MKWKQQYTTSTDLTLSGLVSLPDGFALLGRKNPKNNFDFAAWLVRTDSFGNETCAKSGACITKKAADCDDGNPCTVDLCTAAKGCTHDKAADGTVCAAGKTCTGGVCGL